MFDNLPYRHKGIVYINDIPQPEPTIDKLTEPVKKTGLFRKFINYIKSWLKY